MAVPRVFISSTCYDLQEIRFQLRRFIQEIGYEPVMSEFGDIFYDLGDHVQDACKEEINRSNIFVLVIGNNYGSTYHKHSSKKGIPDSITLQEFRKALEVGIPKYIFINRFVQHDFENYKRLLSRHIAKYFSENVVEDDQIEQTRNKIKKQYDKNYPFPQGAYQYVFYFLDIIYSLDINNARYPFESFEDIREILRKQWAGFVYDALTKESTVSIEKIELLGKKLERIEHQLKLLAESTKVTGENNQITINLDKLTNDMDIDNLEEVQNKIDKLLLAILKDSLYQPRFELKEIMGETEALKFIETIDEIVKSYKWSKVVPLKELMKNLKYAYWKDRTDIPYKALLELSVITNSLSEEDKTYLLKTISSKFNELYVPDQEVSNDEPSGDDIPF